MSFAGILFFTLEFLDRGINKAPDVTLEALVHFRRSPGHGLNLGEEGLGLVVEVIDPLSKA